MRQLDRVTITGADDSVPISFLHTISRKYPFVEWGVLFSRTRQGSHRYPSDQWLRKLARNAVGLRLSAHLCGHWVKCAAHGHADWWRAYPQLANVCQRVQLNFHHQRYEPDGLTLLVAAVGARHQLIFQCDGVNDAAVRQLMLHGYSVPLFDMSGGRGVLPRHWPLGWPCYCGWAGGIGPDNVLDVLPFIADRCSPRQNFWIDMETHVRSADDVILDIGKVVAVLERVKPFVRGYAH